MKMDPDLTVIEQGLQRSWADYVLKLEKKLKERERYFSNSEEVHVNDIVLYGDKLTSQLKPLDVLEKKEHKAIKPDIKGYTVKFYKDNIVKQISFKGSTLKYEIDLCFSVPSKVFQLLREFKPKSYFEEPESVKRLIKLKQIQTSCLSREDFYFLYEYILSILNSSIIELLYNRDRSFVINNTAMYKKWHDKCNIECGRLKRYLPKKLIRLFVDYLQPVMYQKPTSMCQKEIQLRLFFLYQYCEDNSFDDAVNANLCQEIRKLCRNHDENLVVGAAKKLKLDIKNNCFKPLEV